MERERESAPWPRVALVVEDHEGLARQLVRLLRRLGSQEVHAVHSIAAATAAIRESLDLVLCDVRLPDGDCGPVLDMVRARAPTARFVLMTGQAVPAICTELAFKGAHAFLQKPFKPKDLEVAIRSIDIAALAAPRIDDLVRARGFRGAATALRLRAHGEILRQTKGNVSKAARLLRLSRRAVYNVMGERQSSPELFEPASGIVPRSQVRGK